MVTTTTGLATSFITFTRTSNATVTDSNGFIKWAGHNLLTNSESFDASAWVKSSATVTANTDPAPNGTTTGDTIAASGANGTALQTWTAEAVPYTFGVWLRRKTGTGNIQIAADSGTYTTVTITSSWALYTVTQTPAAGSKSAGIRIVTSGDEVYAWGAHLYRSDLGGMVLNPARGDAYYPTTPRNLLGFTEDFSNALWGKANLLAFGSGSISNAIIAPNGLQTADKIVESTANGLHTIDQYYTTTASPYTFSIYLKKAERSFVLVYHGQSNTGIVVNLDTGATTLSAGISAPVASSATSVGDGWYRCSITVNATAASNFFRIYLMPSASVISYTGDGTSGIYLWGAQLSDSASLDAYSPVYDAAVTSAAYYAPRLDYSGSSLAALGLLVEEQRTNVLLHSNDFSQAAWADAAPTSVVTVAANSTASPDGSTNAAKLTASTGGANAMARQARTLVASTVYSGSIYIKGDTSTQSRMLLRDTTSGVNFADATITWTAGVPSIAGGATGTWSAVPVGGNWYRIVGTGTTGASPTPLVTFSLFPDTAAGTNAIFAYGAQLEAGSFATSYIPNGSAVAGATRTADVASVSTQAFPYSSSEGTIVVNATGRGYAPYLYAFAGADNSGTNSLYTYGPTTYTTEAYNGGALQTNSNSGVATGTAIKVAAGYASNNFGVSVNGASVTPDTTYSQPSIDKLRIGSSANITVIGQVYVRQITYIPRRLTNAELVARST